jgi:hypothetical protein
MKFHFVDPSVIMGVVVALIILAVGTFAVFVAIDNIPTTTPSHSTDRMTNETSKAVANVTTTASNVFNIVGVVLIIGAIMTIIGIVYAQMRR